MKKKKLVIDDNRIEIIMAQIERKIREKSEVCRFGWKESVLAPSHKTRPNSTQRTHTHVNYT